MTDGPDTMQRGRGGTQTGELLVQAGEEQGAGSQKPMGGWWGREKMRKYREQETRFFGRVGSTEDDRKDGIEVSTHGSKVV